MADGQDALRRECNRRRRFAARGPVVIECILFDSDGTLVDSEPLTFRVLVEWLERFGAVPDADELHLRYRGWKLGNVLAELEREHGFELPADFEPRFREHQRERFDAELEPIPGVPELLRNLRQARAVVTSGPLAKVRKALAVTGLDIHFGNHVYSAYEVGIWKPDPGIYLHAAADMGFQPARCLAIEDSPIGLQAAVESGIPTVFFNRYGDRCPYEGVTEIRAMAELRYIVDGR
jgi:HAD superfamily hydrolase (TIGR01509 family)